ncbi:hypothetical protein [Spiroplasma endosymbiont of Ammophila pubescens]|uniref:hypothetical protein n=1 Tax=Spiroplasma endosymbiont of Ammophila pubescens TaxID=3066315 RepID=UPI0032B20C49
MRCNILLTLNYEKIFLYLSKLILFKEKGYEKNEDITIIIILITSVIIIFSIGGLFLCVLKGDNEIDYAKHSDCLLYRNYYSKEKINLSNLNNNQLVKGTLQSFNSKFLKKRYR